MAWALPMVVMLGAYAAIAIHTGNWWPWFEFVHESGDRTLMDTVLYYQHAARELPLDVVLGVAIGGCAVFAFPGAVPADRNRKLWLAVGGLFVFMVIVAGTLWTGGPALLWDNFLQMYTRTSEPPLFGSHWRYHFISRLILMLGSFGLAGLTAVILRGKHASGSRRGQSVFFASLGLFTVLTLVFKPDSDPFLNAVFLGHQAREVLTHTLVTVPLSWWFCLVLSRNRGVVADKGAASLAWPLIAAVAGVLLGLYLLIGALHTSAASLGQSESMVILIFPHFFEHVFTYLVVPLVAGLVYETASRSAKFHNTHGTS